MGSQLVTPRMPAEWTVSLGEANEQLQNRFDIDRDWQDAFAARSHHLADRAWTDGSTTPLTTAVPGIELARDENIRPDATVETLARLEPAPSRRHHHRR